MRIGSNMIIDWSWITTTGSALLMIFVTALGLYCFLLLCVRLAGLRSFAKMSSFDFAITVAMGSLIAATLLTKSPPLLHGIAALVALFGIQYLVSWLRRHTSFMSSLVDNEPILLMAGTDVISENLDRARLTVGDLNSHLRQAGIIHPEQVLAVVMETTGDISVLKTGNNNFALDTSLFADVRDGEELLS